MASSLGRLLAVWNWVCYGGVFDVVLPAGWEGPQCFRFQVSSCHILDACKNVP